MLITTRLNYMSEVDGQTAHKQPSRDGVIEDDNFNDEGELPMPEKKIIMDPNFYYPEDYIDNQLEDSPIPARYAEF